MPPFPSRPIRRRLTEGDAAATTEEKGAALEDVIARSFCLVSGLSILRRDQTNSPGSSEIDILLFNERERTGLPFLPHYIIFECKNWAQAVDSDTVRSFIAKVRSARLEVGILVAANGITGDVGMRRAANDIILEAFDRDAIKILVLKRAEIEGFTSTQSIIQLMRNKFADMILRSDAIVP